MFTNKINYFLLVLLFIQVSTLFFVLKGNDFSNASVVAPEPDEAPQTSMLSLSQTAPFPSPILLETPEYPPFPDLNAHAYIVKIIGKDQPLASQRAQKRLAPASLTKIMTVLIAREELVQAEKITFSAGAKNTEDKRSPVKAGETLWRDDAVRLALIPSYNDAAFALAEKIGEKHGGETSEERIKIFLDIMNVKAQALGLADSHFENPSGLDAPGHEMSVGDIVRLAEYIWQNQRLLWDVTLVLETFVRPLGWSPSPSLTPPGLAGIAIRNTNELLPEFPALYGGKTGFTDNAQGALLLLYPVKPDEIAVIVILGSEDRFGDGRKIIHWLDKIVR